MLPKHLPRPLYKTVQLGCILGAALAISACSDSKSPSSGGSSSALSSASYSSAISSASTSQASSVSSSQASSISSAASSSSTSSSSSSSAYVGDPDAGEVVMKSNNCAGCHQDQDRGDGTYAGPYPFNVNNLLAIDNATQASLADYIKDMMPQGSPTSCDADCAADVAAYLWTFKRENLVVDGGFEGTNVTGWAPWNATTLALTASRAYAGLQSLEATNRNNADQFAVYNLTESVEAHTTYKVRAMVMHTGAGPDTLRLGAKIECTTGTAPENHNTYPWLHNLTNVPANVWTLLHADLVLPCELVDVAIFFEGTTAGVSVYIDEVYVTPPATTEEPSEPENLLANGDFETGTSGWGSWDNNAVLSASDAEFYTGTHSLHVNRAASTGNGGHAAADLTALVSRNSSYTVTARAKHNGAGPETLRVAAKVICEVAPAEHNSYPWVNSVSGAPSGEWTLLSGTLSTPDCDLTEVEIYFEGTSAGVDVYIDTVSVVAAE